LSARDHNSANQTSTSGCVAGVVVHQTGRLEKVHRDSRQAGHELASHNGPNDERNEDDEHDKIEDRVADDAPSSKLRLLERVDGWSDLTAMSR
jgi:hypothetical protein